MYPIPFHLFGYPIGSFGIMLALAFLVGMRIAGRRLGELRLDPDLASLLSLYCLLGGILGAKLYYTIDTAILGPGQESFSSLFLSRAGFTFYGGLFGGALGGFLCAKIHRIPVSAAADCSAVALAVGQAIGRIGCFLVGDDYGRETDLPWGIAFPEGAPPIDVPVHPTQLYECAWLFAVAALLWRRRHKSPFLFGELLVLNGLGRFVIEFWRTNVQVAGGMTEAQWIAIALVLGGGGGWLMLSRRRPASP